MSALRAGGSTRAWRRLRAVVLDRDSGRCQCPPRPELGELPASAHVPTGSWWQLYGPPAPALPCGRPANHADHVVSRHTGGTDDLRNLRAACALHNLSRGAAAGDDLAPAPRRRSTPTWEW